MPNNNYNNKQYNYNKYFKIGSLNEISEMEKFYLQDIKKMIVNHFESIGIKYDYEYRTVLRGKLGYPIFVPKVMNPTLKGEYIILSVDNYSYWCQVIYQLSHELTHCFIYCNNKDNNKKSKWIEETICEAMSLYYLKYFLNNWNATNLSKISPDYFKSIEKYLNNILKKEGTNKLSNCNNIQELMILNEHCEENREDRLNEMKTLYGLIDDASIEGLLKYKNFIDGNDLLNIQKYKDNYQNNEAVNYICSIQRKILNN